jgi:hypothetical protein
VFTNSGVSIKPLSPVFLRGEENAEDHKTLYWWRRSRMNGLAGRDGIAAPTLDEPTERYEIDILNAAGTAVLRTLTSAAESVVYTNAQQTADFGSPPATLRLCVYQIGSQGRGYSGCANLTSFAAGDPPAITTLPYVVCCTYPGTLGEPSLRYIVHPPPVTIVFPVNFVGSRAWVLTAFTAEKVFNLQKHVSGGAGTVIGTLTFAASAKEGVFATTGGVEVFFDPLVDILSLEGPATPDTTAADLGVALLGYRLT